MQFKERTLLEIADMICGNFNIDQLAWARSSYDR